MDTKDYKADLNYGFAMDRNRAQKWNETRQPMAVEIKGPIDPRSKVRDLVGELKLKSRRCTDG